MWPEATEPYLVKFASGTSTDTQAEILAAAGAESQSYIRALRIHGVLLPGGDSLQASLDVLDSYASVARVEPNREREAGGTPNDSQYGDQWSLPLIGWENVFGAVTPSGSARVAILDTGIDGSHPDLDGNVVPGTSILDGSDGLSDPNGHGTAMAGIIAAETDNGAGVAGVGYAGVQVMPVTVLGADGTGQDSDIIEGVVYAAENGADVILMAFSNPGYSELLQEAIDYAWDEGAVLVAATGNDGSSSVTFPAGDRGVIGVSNTDQGDALNGSSNYGQNVFLGAPGTGIATTSAGGGYGSITGTSAAAAEVAGAAALVRAASGASNGVIVSRLAKNAEPAGTTEQTGNGRLNVDRAIADESTDSIQPSGADPVGSGGPFVGPYVIAGHSVSPTSLSFTATAGGSNPASKTFKFSGPQQCNGGVASDDQAWLSVSPTSYADFTTASDVTFTVSVDITGLSANTYNGTVTVDDDTTNVACAAALGVPITLVVNPGNTAPTADNKTPSTNEDTPVAITLSGSDADGNALTFAIVSSPNPLHGSLGAIGAPSRSGATPNVCTASVTFTPTANYNGPASFTYKVNDGTVDSADATVSITVNPVNDDPTCDDVSLLTDEDTPGSTSPDCDDVDGDSLSYTFGAASNGTSGFSGGLLTYDPNLNFNGSDTFTYTADDGNGGTATADVDVTVNPVNDPPDAVDDGASVDEDDAGGVLIDVLFNDSKGPANESAQTLAITDPPSTPSHGSAVIESGQIRYTPTEADYFGPDSFTYEACDDGTPSLCDSATVDITVNPVNDPPVASAASPATQSVEYSDAIVDVSFSATDVDSLGSSLAATASFQKDGGSAQAGLPAGLALSVEAPTVGGPFPGGPSGSRTWKVSGVVTALPGTYLVTMTVSDGDATDSTAFTIKVFPECVTPLYNTTYTGAMVFWTTSSTSSTATLNLSASIRACSDGTPGDLTTAKVTFGKRNGDGSVTPITGASNRPVGLADPADPTVGVASAIVQYNLGSSTEMFPLAVTVGGAYAWNDPGDDVIVMVAQPAAGGRIMGVGKLPNGNSLGVFKGAPEAAGPPQEATGFCFDVQYNKSLKNPQGKMILTIHSYYRPNGTLDTDLHTYRVASNAIATLQVKPSDGYAMFTSKTTIVDVTDPGSPVNVDGGANLQVSMYDKASGDELVISVYNSKSGGLWYSSNWASDGTKSGPVEVAISSDGFGFISVQ